MNNNLFTSDVVVLGKPNCMYCEKAKQLLNEKGIPHTYQNVLEQPELIEFIKTTLHRTTVPQIRYSGQWIGGYTELEELLT